MHIYILFNIIHLFTYIVYLFINLKYLSGNYAIVDSSCQCDLDYLAVVDKSNVFFLWFVCWNVLGKGHRMSNGQGAPFWNVLGTIKKTYRSGNIWLFLKLLHAEVVNDPILQWGEDPEIRVTLESTISQLSCCVMPLQHHLCWPNHVEFPLKLHFSEWNPH